MTDQPSLFSHIDDTPITQERVIDEYDLISCMKEISVCDRCSYSKSRKNIVVGDGDPRSDIWVVGECPGPDEDVQGIPFVGVTGQLLRKVLDAVGATSEKIYITNRVRCKPTVGLNPDGAALQACTPWLERQVEIADPPVIVSIGKHSTAFFLGLDYNRTKITKLTGEKFIRGGRTIIPIFHPSYAKRQNMSDIAYLKHFHQLLKVISKYQ